MESVIDKQIDNLAQIIKALADVWPNDRENVMTAGAAFEEFVSELENPGVQLNKLIDLSWKGMRHLFEEDAYFISVKNATMQGVNTIREYLLQSGNITVDVFEKSCERLETALAGAAESADKIIELKEDESAGASEQTDPEQEPEPYRAEDEHQGKDEDVTASDIQEENLTLNDLASAMMQVGEAASAAEIDRLREGFAKVAAQSSPAVSCHLDEGCTFLNDAVTDPGNNWFEKVSEKIEQALQALDDESWDQEIKEPEPGQTNEEEPLLQREEESVPVNPDVEESEIFHVPGDIDLEMVKEFVTECNDLIETAESALLDLETNPGDNELINTIFRAFHTIKGTSAFMGLDPITRFTHLAETLLSNIRDGDLSFDRASADISLDSIDVIKKLLLKVGRVSGGDPLPTTKQYRQIYAVLSNIAEQGMKPEEALYRAEPTREKEADRLDETEQTEDQQNPVPMVLEVNDNGAGIPKDDLPVSKDQDATVRVNLGRLDRLIDMVGELVIAHSVVSQDSTIAKDSDLMKKVDHTSKILRELQDTSLTLRMVPLKATFHKMNRLVRDLARKAGKHVTFTTFGDDTEIDRNMVDIINEPLVHMLRNSIDHGVETPDERAAAGKSDKANIWLRAYQEGGKVVIEIEDDGKGINKEKIVQKAIGKGLVTEDKKLTDSEICALIFHPGLSSVDKVTDLSGRGVGMDVVRRSIEQLQGKVDVESQWGRGTKVSLELPFTLAITDGMLVSVGSQKFIIPTINIEMTFRAKQEDVFTILGTSEQVKYRGMSVPILRLGKMFHVTDGVDNLVGGTLVIIKNNNKLYALLVDEIIGQQQLVGKSINMNVKMPHISGGAILGDGKVGLILDTSALVA